MDRHRFDADPDSRSESKFPLWCQFKSGFGLASKLCGSTRNKYLLLSAAMPVYKAVKIWSILNRIWKKFSVQKVKITCDWNWSDPDRPDPDRHAMNADPSPDPTKWSGFDPIRIPNMHVWTKEILTSPIIKLQKKTYTGKAKNYLDPLLLQKKFITNNFKFCDMDQFQAPRNLFTKKLCTIKKRFWFPLKAI